MKFSVIIPLYNKAPYIQRAIDSVLKQTFQNFEIIVVDDGSTDGGEEIVKKISDKRIHLIHQDNSGVSAARNKGGAHAQNDYLVFLDADDTWESNFLEKIDELIEKYPNAGIYGTSNYFIFPNGNVVSENYDYLFDGKETGVIKDYFGLFADIQKSPFSNSNLCIPKKKFREFGGYKIGVKLTEDSDLWCRIALKYPIAFNVLPLANYYLDIEGSTVGIFQSDEFQVSKTLKNALLNNEVKEEYVSSVRKLIIFQKLSLIKRALITGNKLFAFRNLFDIEIAKHYPKEFLQSVIVLLIPKLLFDKIRKLRHK